MRLAVAEMTIEMQWVVVFFQHKPIAETMDAPIVNRNAATTVVAIVATAAATAIVTSADTRQ